MARRGREADVGPHRNGSGARGSPLRLDRRSRRSPAVRAEQQAERAAPRGSDARKILNLTTPFFWVAVVIGVGVVGSNYLRRDAVPGEARRGAQAEAGPRQHRARDQLDDHPGRDPRGDGRADRRDDLQAREEAEGSRRRPRHRRPRASGGGSTRTPTRATASVTANEMHIPVGQPVSLTLQGPPLCARRAVTTTRHPLVLGPGAHRQEGRRARAAASS